MFSRNGKWHQNCKSEKKHLQFRCKVLSNLLNNLSCFGVLRNFLRNCFDNYDFIWIFLGIFMDHLWNFLGNFFKGIFWRNVFEGIFREDIFWINFLGGFFLEKFFERNFLGGLYIFGEELFGRNSLLTLSKLYERDWFVCQDFVSIEMEGKFQSLEVREQAPSHLKTNDLAIIVRGKSHNDTCSTINS